MNPSKPTLNRRDWFRLRSPIDASQLPNAPRLRPIDHPPNHDGMDLGELPPISEAFISREEVQLLFSDLTEHANNIQLFHKGGNSRAELRPGGNPDNLLMAASAFLQGLTSRLQVRYSWNEAAWIDTLEANDTGYRLVRIKHPEQTF